MNTFKTRLLIQGIILIAAQHLAFAQSAPNSNPDPLQLLIEAVQATTPLPASESPVTGSFYSAQFGTIWPPLPANTFGFPFWPLGDNMFVVDDRSIDYAQLRAEAEAAALLFGEPGLNISTANSTTAYGNQPYLTNMTASLSGGGVTASFSIAGGTNNVPYDILMSTNVAAPISNWPWLAIGYTSNKYSFASQPLEQAFYILAKPQKTMVVGFGNDAVGQCELPMVITNALMVAGGGGQSLALLNDGTVRAWGQNAYGQGSVPTNLAGVTMISAHWCPTRAWISRKPRTFLKEAAGRCSSEFKVFS
jgi:hypothetical protein